MNSSNELMKSYSRDGYIQVPGFIPPDLFQEIRGRLERYEREIAPSAPEADRVYEADGSTFRNLWRMEHHDPFFSELAHRPEIRALIASLVHGDPVLMAVETFNKPPRVGSGVPPHQDNAYFCQTPADVLTVWIAIDAATLENGPICYLKGSHIAGVLPHRPSGVTGNSMGLARMPDHEKKAEFCGTLEAGDALIHHCQTIHWSAPNKSDKSRRGLLLVYRGAHTTADPMLKAAYDAARSVKS